MQGKCRDTYKEIKTFEYPNAIVRVHIPDLTLEERERRMEVIKAAAAVLVLESEKKARV